MPALRIHVAFTPDAAASLRSQLGADWARPRALFTMEPLRSAGTLPGAGDLVADLRLADRIWRVEQRSVLVEDNADATISLLVAAADARLTTAADAERVQLTDDAQAALFAEHVGHEQPSACRLLMVPGSAMPQLRAGDVVRDASVSRHLFLVEERLFLWDADNRLQVRYLLSLGLRARELRQWRD